MDCCRSSFPLSIFFSSSQIQTRTFWHPSKSDRPTRRIETKEELFFIRVAAENIITVLCVVKSSSILIRWQVIYSLCVPVRIREYSLSLRLIFFLLVQKTMSYRISAFLLHVLVERGKSANLFPFIKCWQKILTRKKKLEKECEIKIKPTVVCKNIHYKLSKIAWSYRTVRVIENIWISACKI